MSFPDRYHHDPMVNVYRFEAAKQASQVNNKPQNKYNHSKPGVVHSHGPSDYVGGYQY